MRFIKDLPEGKKIIALFLLNTLLLVAILLLNIPGSAFTEFKSSFYSKKEVSDESVFEMLTEDHLAEYDEYMVYGDIKREDEMEELVDHVDWISDIEISNLAVTEVIILLYEYEEGYLNQENLDDLAEDFIGTVGKLINKNESSQTLTLDVFYSPPDDLTSKNINLTVPDEIDSNDIFIIFADVFTEEAGEEGLVACMPVYPKTIKSNEIISCVENGLYIAAFCEEGACKEGSTIKSLILYE